MCASTDKKQPSAYTGGCFLLMSNCQEYLEWCDGLRPTGGDRQTKTS
jgi:hypothetical protein